MDVVLVAFRLKIKGDLRYELIDRLLHITSSTLDEVEAFLEQNSNIHSDAANVIDQVLQKSSVGRVCFTMASLLPQLLQSEPTFVPQLADSINLLRRKIHHFAHTYAVDTERDVCFTEQRVLHSPTIGSFRV